MRYPPVVEQIVPMSDDPGFMRFAGYLELITRDFKVSFHSKVYPIGAIEF